MTMKSSKVVPFQQPNNAVVYTASVLAVDDDNYCEIELAGARVQALVTFSCLVRPVCDDVVMCVLSESGDYYIIGIIERRAGKSMSMSFPDDVTMQSLGGSINLHTAESVNIAAVDSINSVSNSVLHKCDKAVIDYDDLTISGTAMQASYSRISVFCQLMSTFSRQVLQKCKNYIRHSEESDLVRAGNMSRKAKGVYSMNSQHTIMSSKKDTKIDGEHIHMG